MMKKVGYRVVAYAASERVVNGTDLLVLLKLPYGGLSLRAYIIDDWQSVLRPPDELVAEYIRDVLFDVRQHLLMNEPEVDAFFEAINEMNVGPLRISASGVCHLEGIENLHLELGGQTNDLIRCSPDAFLTLKNRIQGLDHQLQAARS